MNEEWRPIEGWPFYEVSSLGRVRCWRRMGPRDLRTDEPRIVKQHIGSKPGYYHVGLGHRGGRHRVHLLVAAAFLGPRPDGQIVRHLNDNSLDNRVENLAYGTHRDNWLDAVANGRRVGKRAAA